MNWRLLVGDVREKLAEIEVGSVQTCVTSPPYWGLRDYGTGRWEGGSIECDHKSGRFERGGLSSKQASNSGSGGDEARGDCPKCGARRIDSQIGLEATPDEFVANLVAVFRDVKRVLKDDGTIWVNLGDSYLAQRGSGFNGQKRLDHANRNVKVQRPAGMKPKDLAGIPWMVAFALRADGWYLRSDIIWAKPNPMPESVTDRPTKAHEYIFLLSKSQRYFYDADAIAELASDAMISQMEQGYMGEATKDYASAGVQNPSSVKARIIAGKRQRLRVTSGRAEGGMGIAASGNEGKPYDEQDWRKPTRNVRSVWTIATQPYPEAHFATFPEAIPERCIKAGSRVGDLVLDPFTGSGTTGAVALRLGREFVGVELNTQYAELARARIGGAAPLFSHEQSA